MSNQEKQSKDIVCVHKRGGAPTFVSGYLKKLVQVNGFIGERESACD